MKKIIAFVLIFMLAFSCKKEKKTYYPDGSLKTIAEVANSRYHGSFKAFYDNGELEFEGTYDQGLMEGIFTYYHKPEHKFSKSETLLRNDTAYYRRDYNKSGKLVEEGSLEENSKVGKWMYYDIEEGYSEKIREVFYINGKSHLNQEWGLNKKGDTIGGRYYILEATDSLDFHNQVIRFRVEWLPYFLNSEIYVCLPSKKSKLFESHFSNEKDVILDTIGSFALWQENNPDEYRNGAGVINVKLNYDTPGKKMLRGYLLEKKSVADFDTLDYELVTRKIYFEKEIYIKVSTEDNSKRL